MQKNPILGIIGGGVMARAIATGAIQKKFISSDRVIVSEPNAERAERFLALGASVADGRTLIKSCDFLLLAVKPQSFNEVARELRGEKIPTVISIMAGMTKKAIQSALGEGVKVIRAMPNLPCSVGEGMIAVDASDVAKEEKEFALGLFSATGKVTEVTESQLNAVTGISGSGPAYVYLFLQSLTEAGKEQGLSEEQAYTLALQTVKGGLRLAEENPQTPLSELIASVSSKGGTTVAALDSFQKDGFQESVARAVDAAVKRAKEISL